MEIFEGQQISLHQLFDHYHPREAIIMGRNAIRYGDWAIHLAMTLEELQNLGVHRGERIGLYLHNSFEYINLILASWITKLQVVFIPITFPESQVMEIIKDYNIQYLIVEKPLTIDYPGIPVAQFTKAFRKRTKAYEQNKVNFQWNISYDQEVSIIFSSGTVGKPKGIIHTLKNFLYSALGTNQHYLITESDSWVLSLPLFHVGGLLIVLRMLLAGGKIIIPTADQKLSTLLYIYEPTFISLVSTQFIRLLNKESNIERLKTLKAILVGGGPLPEWPISLSKEQKIPLSLTYGSTEMCSQITAHIPFSHASSPQSTGPILPFRALQLSLEGKVMVKGETLFKAYTHGQDYITPFDSEGWFLTQDIGSWDEEGHLHIHGRADQVFISGGENIRPDLIEGVIKKIPWVSEAIVVPVPHPEFGQVPMAFIEMARKIPVKKILLYLKEQLPNYMVPKRIVFLDEENPYKGGIKYNRQLLVEKAQRFGGVL